MGIKRYTADADNTIVSAYQSNLSTRGTGSNTGQADVLEVFSIYGRQQASSSAAKASQELSRVLIKFPVDTISADRTAGKIAASGSVSFYLRMFGAGTSKTVPRDYKLVAQAISQSWEEGDGLDLENYKDKTNNGTGSNWINANGNSQNATATLTALSKTAGQANTRTLVITDIAGNSVTFTIDNSISTSTATKIAFGNANSNASQFATNIAAAINAANDAESLNVSASASSATVTLTQTAAGLAGNENSSLNVTGTGIDESVVTMASSGGYQYSGGGELSASLYSGSSDNSVPSGSKLTLYNGATSATGGNVSTGIYSCSIAITRSLSNPIETLYDVWHNGAGTQYFTGSIKPIVLSSANSTREPIYYISITNLQNKYIRDQKARFNVFIREKYWSPTIYTKASQTPATIVMPSASYRVTRTLDGMEAVSYGTGSDLHTVLSYDIDGNYFDFDMNLLQPGYEYAFKLSFYDPELTSWQEQNETFKFRVEDYEY